MIGDLCKPINKGEDPVVKIAMSIHEVKPLMADLENGYGCDLDSLKRILRSAQAHWDTMSPEERRSDS